MQAVPEHAPVFAVVAHQHVALAFFANGGAHRFELRLLPVVVREKAAVLADHLGGGVAGDARKCRVNVFDGMVGLGRIGNDDAVRARFDRTVAHAHRLLGTADRRQALDDQQIQQPRGRRDKKPARPCLQQFAAFDFDAGQQFERDAAENEYPEARRSRRRLSRSAAPDRRRSGLDAMASSFDNVLTPAWKTLALATAPCHAIHLTGIFFSLQIYQNDRFVFLFHGNNALIILYLSAGAYFFLIKARTC